MPSDDQSGDGPRRLMARQPTLVTHCTHCEERVGLDRHIKSIDGRYYAVCNDCSGREKTDQAKLGQLVTDGGRDQFGDRGQSETGVKQNAGGAECPICDEPIVIHTGPHTVTTAGVHAIQDAVDHSNRHPSNNERDGDLKYVVEEGYYPREWSHFVDLSDVPEDLRYSASIQITSQLAKRGLAVNSVRWDPPKLHVIGAHWLYDRLPGDGGINR